MGHSAAKTQARQRLNSLSGSASATSAERRAESSMLRQRKQAFKKADAKRQAAPTKVVKVQPLSRALPPLVRALSLVPDTCPPDHVRHQYDQQGSKFVRECVWRSYAC